MIGRGSSSRQQHLVLGNSSAARCELRDERAGALVAATHLMCTRRCVRAPASLLGCALPSSQPRAEKLLLLWLVDMRDVHMLPSLASEARENESRDCALAALLECSASSCIFNMRSSALQLSCCSSCSAASAPLLRSRQRRESL